MEHNEGNNRDDHITVKLSSNNNVHKCNCTEVYLRLRSQVIQDIKKLNTNDPMQSTGCLELRKVMEIELNTLNNLQNLK